jgi:hypothetical protein
VECDEDFLFLDVKESGTFEEERIWRRRGSFLIQHFRMEYPILLCVDDFKKVSQNWLVGRRRAGSFMVIEKQQARTINVLDAPDRFTEIAVRLDYVL